MAVRSGFFNSMGTDKRTYYNSDMSRLVSLLINDGVFQNYGKYFLCKPGTGLQVIVQTGKCWFNERWVLNDTDLQIDLDTAPIVAGYRRIDVIAIKIDDTNSVRLGIIEYIPGTAGSNPTEPTLTDTEMIHYHKLCAVTVSTNQTTITASNIKNYIGTTTTPFITGILKTIDITELLTQWQSLFNDWKYAEETSFINWRDTQETEFETWETNQQTQFDNWKTNFENAMDGWKTGETTDFEAWYLTTTSAFMNWFDSLQTTLDGDVAGHLENQINDLKECYSLNELLGDKKEILFLPDGDIAYDSDTRKLTILY